MPTVLRLAGVILLICTFPLSFRLVWEMTILTWQEGPQMIGFSLFHTVPLFAVLGALSGIGLMVWLVATLLLKAAGHRHFTRADWILVVSAFLCVVSPVLPQAVWLRVTTIVLGDSPTLPDMLCDAASSGDFATVRYLLSKGIPVDHVGLAGCASLALAAGGGDRRVVGLLLSHHPSLERPCQGESALQIAAQKGNSEVVMQLLRAGASSSAKNANGFTASELAWGSGHEDVSRLIEAFDREHSEQRGRP